MITFLILIPIIGAIMILFINTECSISLPLLDNIKIKTNNTNLNISNTIKKPSILRGRQITLIRKIALNTALLNFFISLILWYFFDSNNTQYQFVSEFNQLNFCHFNFGIDGISLFFVLLTTFVTPIAILSNYYNINSNLKVILISLLLLESLQICAFVSLDLLLFYIFFESAKWCGLSLLCLKLSNSGDTLKLLIPNYSQKAISGQNNYLGTVTSHKMNESEMGYRGSKSEMNISSVKEQRVDGSYLFEQNKLRCTLMGFERNYQISNPFNQINMLTFRIQVKKPCLSRKIYTQSNKLNIVSKYETKISSLLAPKGIVMEPSKILDSWFLTGFTDGEGCFGLYIYKNTSSKSGWYAFLDFKFTIHKRDKEILNKIKFYFNAGEISKHREQSINYGLRSVKDISLIINHFDNFPLKTKKLNDFKLFKLAFDIIKNKEHLTKEGLEKLITIKSFMNRGLSTDLQLAFSKIKLDLLLLDSSSNTNLDPNWIAGFVSGEGSFQVDIRKNKTVTIGYQVLLRFSIGQHSRDEELLKSLIIYFDCGKVQKKINKKYNREHFEFRVEKFGDLYNKIIPFFIKYPIEGQKILDFQDFCKVANLINDRAHITIEGLNKIRKIKEGMNRCRV